MADETSPADKVIATFGGLTATAKALGVGVTTVQGWKDRKRIPPAHWVAIQQAADKVGKPIALTELLGIAA